MQDAWVVIKEVNCVYCVEKSSLGYYSLIKFMTHCFYPQQKIRRKQKWITCYLFNESYTNVCGKGPFFNVACHIN